MNAERQDFFKQLLEERLAALLQDAGASIVDLTDERESPSDTLDVATLESSRDFVLRLRDRDRQLIHKIRLALKRIDEGDYGHCIACGEEIGERRLMARPVATHCIDCKTEVEQLERRRGAI